MHTRAWKRHRQFKHIQPGDLHAGDIIACYIHDDQWEARAARVCYLRYADGPGFWRIPVPHENRTQDFHYGYFVYVVLRHINTADLSASGGKPFQTIFYPWNSVYRYEPDNPLAFRR